MSLRAVWGGFGAALLLASCAGTGMLPGAGSGDGQSFREYLVIGSPMSFEACRAGGGLIITDRDSPMTACDPSVKRRPPPATATAPAEDLNAALEQRDMDAAR